MRVDVIILREGGKTTDGKEAYHCHFGCTRHWSRERCGGEKAALAQIDRGPLKRM